MSTESDTNQRSSFLISNDQDESDYALRMCVSSLQNIVGWCDAQEFSQVQYLEWTASGLGRVAFQVYRTKKKQANSSPSLLRLLSTSPLPIFRVSPTICLSDVLPCLMPITKYAIVGARDPTARKRCRKLQRAPLGLTCRTVTSNG